MSSVLLESIHSRPLSDARRRTLFLLSGPVLYSIVAVLLGKKTGWDLFNYHWYNPFAWLTSRFNLDVAVGHTAAYYSPIADVPLYLIASHGPSWFVGIFLGAMTGITVSLIGAIAYVALPDFNERHRLFAAASLAVIGSLGAGAFQEIGDPANDIPAAIGTYAAILLLLRNLSMLAQSRVGGDAIRTLLVSGILAGIAVALKLTMAVYALGLGVAILTVRGGALARLYRASLFGVGVTAGLMVVGGFWMLKLWRFSGNPFFPYFNNLFHSPLLGDAGYLDGGFWPRTWNVRLFFPFYFTADSHYVSESGFRDAHILALYILLPVSVLIASWKKPAVVSPAAKLLFAFATVSYVAWLVLFDIYRYLIPLEMIAPLLIAMAIMLWPARIQLRIAAIAIVLIATQLAVKVDLSDRQSWDGPYVQVYMPTKSVENDSMVLMTGHEPMSFLIPSFPSSVPFLRIDGWLIQGSDTTSGLARQMRARVAAHSGPLYLLSSPDEREAALSATRSYGLRVDPKDPRCERITSNVSLPSVLCPVSRLAAE